MPNVHSVLQGLACIWPMLTQEQSDMVSETIASFKGVPPPVCNCCGKPLDEWDVQEDFHIHTRVGYGSTHDTEEIDLHLCCDCFDKLVDACKVSPVVGDDT